jgi:hypothetical protein
MNSFVFALGLTTVVSLTSLAGPDLKGAQATGPGPTQQSSKRDRPTKLAQFGVGAFVAANGHTLRVNVEKQLGGEVYIQLLDRKGKSCFNWTLWADEPGILLRIDLSELADSDYKLKVSNGLDMVVRDVKVSTIEPIYPARSIKIQ